MSKIVRTRTRAEGGLTEEERQKMAEHVKIFTARAYRTEPIDVEKITAAIHGIYSAAGKTCKRVVIVDSPLVMAVAGGFAAAIWHLRKNRDALDPNPDPFEDVLLEAESRFKSIRNASVSIAISDCWRDTLDPNVQEIEDAVHEAANGATCTAIESLTRSPAYSASVSAADSPTRADIRTAGEFGSFESNVQEAAFDSVVEAMESAFVATDPKTSISAEVASRVIPKAAIYSATDDATRTQTNAFAMVHEIAHEAVHVTVHEEINSAVSFDDSRSVSSAYAATQGTTDEEIAYAARDTTYEATKRATDAYTRHATIAETSKAATNEDSVDTIRSELDATLFSDTNGAIAEINRSALAAAQRATHEDTGRELSVMIYTDAHSSPYDSIPGSPYDSVMAAIEDAVATASIKATSSEAKVDIDREIRTAASLAVRRATDFDTLHATRTAIETLLEMDTTLGFRVKVAAELAVNSAADSIDFYKLALDIFGNREDAVFALECAKKWWRMYQGGNMWQSLDCYLTATRDILGLDLPEYKNYDAWEQASIHGGFRIVHEEFCIVSNFPEHIKIDANNLPHCENGSSHKWRDGWELFYWHGVKIPGDWVSGKKPTAQEAITWPNIEQRRAACEIVGWSNILDQLDAKSIDVDDPEIGELLEVDLPDSGREKFLSVRCGTGRKFCIPVPREMKTALEANAWTYGLDAYEYKPEVRT